MTNNEIRDSLETSSHELIKQKFDWWLRVLREDSRAGYGDILKVAATLTLAEITACAAELN